jgi:hypothetical protein
VRRFLTVLMLFGWQDVVHGLLWHATGWLQPTATQEIQVGSMTLLLAGGLWLLLWLTEKGEHPC